MIVLCCSKCKINIDPNIIFRVRIPGVNCNQPIFVGSSQSRALFEQSQDYEQIVFIATLNFTEQGFSSSFLFILGQFLNYNIIFI